MFRFGAFAALLGYLIFQVHLFALSSNSLQDINRESIRAIGVISTDPVRTKERVYGSRLVAPKTTFLMRLEEISDTDSNYRIRLPVRVVLRDYQGVELFPGTRIRLTADLNFTNERRVAATLYASGETIEILRKPFLAGALENVRVGLRTEVAKQDDESAALIPGLVLGDTTLQSNQLSDLMRQSGLTHLTAVSGANFAIVGTFVFSLLALIAPKRRPRIIITTVILFLFVILVRPTPSVLRASVMTGSYLLARFLGFPNQAKNSLATAVVILLLINPLQAFEPGFILSVLATSGLIYISPKISEKLKGPESLRDLLAIPLAATITCSPYLMYLAGSLNLGTVLINVLVAPVIGVVTISGFIATILVIPMPIIARPFIEVSNIGCHWILFTARFSESFPTISSGPLLLILLALPALLFRAKSRKFGIALSAATLIVASYSTILFPGKNWVIGQCDVGQGDALLIRVALNEAILFDAGPDPKLLKRCLNQFGIHRLPLIVISHQHADHFMGITTLTPQQIGEIWVNHPFADLDRFAGKVRAVTAGYEASIASTKLSVIWPINGSESFTSTPGDGSIENNRSLVIKIEHEGAEILVTGDIEPGAQLEILRRSNLSDIDIMKVPHHGSKYQIPEFFIHAKHFLISVGKNNYGHPDPGLIKELERMGSVERTDNSGAISLTWQSDQAEPVFSPRRLGKEWWRLNWHWLR